MLTLRGSAHIRTSRNIKGLHACSTSTGFSLFHLHAWQMSRESASLKTRELRRALIAHLWREHMERCQRMSRGSVFRSPSGHRMSDVSL